MAKTYERHKLEGMIDLYLAALAKNDPSRLPVTKHVSFAENYQPLKLGEGIWTTITGIGTYKHYFADTLAGAAGFIGTVRENGVGALLDIRLQLDGDLISEIETFIIRDALSCARYEEMGKPEDVWLEPVPLEQRLPRAKMITSVNKYFESMENNDGRGDYSFFDRECNRIEHALQTTNVKKPQAYGHSTDTDFSSMTAEQQWKTGFLGFVTEIRDRRFVVLDEERQAVFTIVTLDHNGTVRKIDLTTGKTFVVPPYFDVPRTLNVMEAFRLRGDKLYRIEMTLTELPYGTRPPSASRASKFPRAAVADEKAGDLARNLGQVLAALRAHDPARLPLAKNARYTENGQQLKLGDGLWGTLTGYAGPDGVVAATPVPQYRIELVDSRNGDAVYLGGIVEETTPGLLALRLRQSGGFITEIEAIVIRKEEMGERGGTVTLFQPRLITEFDPAGFAKTDPSFLEVVPASERSAEGELVGVVDRYFDGIENDTSKGIPIARDCTRRDNGVLAAGNPAAPPLDPAVPAYRPLALSCAEQIDSGYFKRISKVRDRQHVVDAERGLVLSIAAFDNPARIKAFDVPGIGRVTLPGAMRGGPGSPQAMDQAFGMSRSVNVVVPTTELTVQLTKIRAGNIVGIETLSRGGPFGMTTGWATQYYLES